MASFSGITLDTGKDEKDCMFEQTGLGLFIFDENKLIAVGFHLIQVFFSAIGDYIIMVSGA